MVSFFLFLIAGMVAGSAFSYGATDATLYGIGRTLSFFSAGFVPVVFYMIYREFTVGRPTCADRHAGHYSGGDDGTGVDQLAAQMIWMVVETANGLQTSELLDHYWYTVSTRRLRMACSGTRPLR